MTNELLEEEKHKCCGNCKKESKPFFTTGRILFLIVVFFVFSMPLIMRYAARFL